MELARSERGFLLRESDIPRCVVVTSTRRLAALLERVKAGRFDCLSC